MLMAVFFVAATSMFTSCKNYDDDIAQLNEKVDANKKAIDQINSLITSGSVITNVEKQDKGLLVTLSNGKSYTVSNGTDAVIWSIGDDGFWYKDGVKTSYYALGKDGKDGKDGTNGTNGKDGKNGTNGTNGTNGKDGKNGTNGEDGDPGIYYYPNPETGNFDIYNGDGTFKQSTTISWKATVSNLITAVMDHNDLKLYGVQGYDGAVTIARSNDLRGLVLIPDQYDGGVPAIYVEYTKYNVVNMNNEGKGKSETWTESSTKKDVPVTNYAYYHVNPANARIDDLKGVQFVLKSDVPYNKRNAKSQGLKVTAKLDEEFGNQDGKIRVIVDVQGTPASGDYISVAALQLTKENGEDITSEYAALLKKDIVINTNMRIVANITDANRNHFMYNVNAATDYHYRRYINALDNAAGDKAYISTHKPWIEGDDDLSVDLLLFYDKNKPATNPANQLDLNQYVKIHEVDVTPHRDRDVIADYGMSFKFESIGKYEIGPNNTDQNAYISVSDKGVVSIGGASGFQASALDKTPIIRVKLMHNGNIVKVAYIKLKIVVPPSTPDRPTSDPQFVLMADNFKFLCTNPIDDNKTTWRQMSLYLYDEMNMSKAQFHTAYEFDGSYSVANYLANEKADTSKNPPVTAGDGKSHKTVGTVTELAAGGDLADAGTHVLEWTLTPQELWDNSGSVIYQVVRYKHKTRANSYVYVVLKAEVEGTTKSVSITNAMKLSNFWNEAKTEGKFNVNVPDAGSTNDALCLYENDINSLFITKDGKIDGLPSVITKFRYEFNSTMNKSVAGYTLKVDAYDEASNKSVLRATKGGVTQVIAEITNDRTSLPFNLLTYNKNSTFAKDLLNQGTQVEGQMKVDIKMSGFACDDVNKPIQMTFEDKAYFTALMVRPVIISQEAADNFIDGVDFGQRGSVIDIKSLLNPRDWRGRLFSQYDNYWKYYGLAGGAGFSVNPDIAESQANFNDGRGWVAVPATILLTIDSSMGSGFGAITYKNSGTVLQKEFKLRVKVDVNYGWGTMRTDWIEIPVKPLN